MLNFEALGSDNRQHKSGNDSEERALREDETKGLVHDVIGKHEAFFSVPENRISFLVGQNPDDFMRLTQYVNAKLRGEKPHALRYDENEGNGALPMLHTPAKAAKPEAFRNGFSEIQKYLSESDDDIERKIEGAAMAVEALVVWVHPFNDGNGRTSRFLAKLIEDGPVDMDGLIAQTAFKQRRGSLYKEKYKSREGFLTEANNEDIIFEDDEREELREKARKAPPDVRAIPLSIKRLLENEDVRQRARDIREKYAQPESLAA